MNAVIENFLNELRIGEPLTYENLTMYPLFMDSDESISYISLDTALTNSMVEVRELDKGASVPELLFINKSDKKIFLMDGEELLGAKQNRIINTAILINKKSENVISVSCVEQSRWSYKTQTFQKSEYSLPNSMRRKNMGDIEISLKKSLGYRADQGKVWSGIEEMSRAAGTSSPTMAMNDILGKKKSELNKISKKMKVQDNQKGMIVTIDGELAGMDFISRKEVFKGLFNKILNSYATDMVIKFNNKTNIKANGKMSPEKVIDELKKMKTEEFNSPALGHDIRMSKDGLSATALVYRKRVISFSSGITG